jgi:hypothetical protein
LRGIVTIYLFDFVEVLVILNHRLGIPFIHAKPLLNRLLIVVTSSSPRKSFNHNLLWAIEVQNNLRLNDLSTLANLLKGEVTFS